jgi:hypothetical protein
VGGARQHREGCVAPGELRLTALHGCQSTSIRQLAQGDDMVTRRYVPGLDLGPAVAFTALAFVERADDDNAPAIDPQLAVKHLQRFRPIGETI